MSPAICLWEIPLLVTAPDRGTGERHHTATGVHTRRRKRWQERCKQGKLTQVKSSKSLSGRGATFFMFGASLTLLKMMHNIEHF